MEELELITFSLKNHRTYFLKSAVLDRLPTCFSTSFSFTTIVSPFKSGASKLMFSSTFSKIVCRLLAPIFSTLKLTSSANEHIFSIPSSLKMSLTPSVSINAIYWFVRLLSVSVKIFLKCSFLKGFSCTLMGRRPCSSGRRSDGFDKWKAPEQIKRI